MNEELLQKAADSINRLFAEKGDKAVLFMVSGGSAFKLLDLINTDSFGERITITVLDERFSRDPKVNNFLQLEGTEFYSRAEKAGCGFISTVPGGEESIELLADRFERELRGWKEDHPDGIVIIIQGIGTDGHTSGIMPFPDDPQLFGELFEGDRWVVGYDAGEKNQYPLRVTTTITFLREVVDYSVVYAAGEDKKEILKKLYSKKYNLPILPSGVVGEMKNARLFTDQET